MSELNTFAAWEAALTAMGYRIAAASPQGSTLFACDGKPSYRLSAYGPNDATVAWMKRNGTVDARCQFNGNPLVGTMSDLPEFGPTEPQFRIIDCIQGSEEWDKLRARPTASNFHRIVTPVNGDYAATASQYAAEIVAKRLGVWTESPPSFWMTHGTEMEPLALAAYEEANNVTVRKVGFITPLFTDVYGGSPDGLVGNDGGIEIKCPKPETLIGVHATGTMPDQYKPQLQGLMMISRLPWWDFYMWHPGLTPFQIRVYADDAYQTKIAKAIYKLLEEVERIGGSVSRNPDYISDDDDEEEPEIIITGDSE